MYPDAFPVYPKYVKSECIPEMSVSRMHSRKSECIPDTQKTRLARALSLASAPLQLARSFTLGPCLAALFFPAPPPCIFVMRSRGGGFAGARGTSGRSAADRSHVCGDRAGGHTLTPSVYVQSGIREFSPTREMLHAVSMCICVHMHELVVSHVGDRGSPKVAVGLARVVASASI